jgi:hypothetical protein
MRRDRVLAGDIERAREIVADQTVRRAAERAAGKLR